MLVDRLNLPATFQGSASASGHGMCPSAPIPIAPAPHGSQLNEPACTTTSFNSVPPPLLASPPSLADDCPTRTITLAGQFKLSFAENDVPHAPSISFADDLDALNSMWDDTSSYWQGHSALVVNNFPIAITYWKQVYTSKNGKNWKPGQWKILKGRYFEWRVSLITSLWFKSSPLSKVLVERYRCGTPAEFWSAFSPNGNRWNYKSILKQSR